MTCPRLRRVLRFGAILLAAPLIAWVLVVSLLPTGWARARIVEGIERATGQEVGLEQVRLGPCGGLHLRGLRLAEAGKAAWLDVDRLLVMPHLRALLSGRVEPTRIEASGVSVRAERPRGGQFPFCDLLRTEQDEGSGSFRNGMEPLAERSGITVDVHLKEARVSLRDEASGTALELANVAGTGVWRHHRATLERLGGVVNGGTFELEAEVERTPVGPTIETQLRATGVEVGQGMQLLAYLVPVFSGTDQELRSRMDLSLYLRGHGDTRAELGSSLVGQGTVKLDPIQLRESPLVSELTRVLHLPDRLEIGTFRSDFSIAQGRVISNAATLEAAGAPIVLAGSTDFDGKVDYVVKSQAISEALAPILSEMPVGLDDVVELRIVGTPGHLVATLEGIPLNGSAQGGRAEGNQIREVGRRFLDRLLR